MHTSMTKESLLKRVFDKDPVLIIAGPLQSGKTTQTQLFKESFKQLHPEKDLFTVSLEEELEKELPNFPPWAIKKIKEVKDIGGSQPVCIESMLWTKKVLYEHKEGPILIEGSPTSYGAASAMLEFFNTLEKKVFMLHLNISEEEMIRRTMARNEVLLKNGFHINEDCTTEKKIKSKLNFYDSHVTPGIRKFSACSKAVLLSFESKRDSDPKLIHLEILKSIAYQHH